MNEPPLQANTTPNKKAKIISIISVKGGVGKTTIATNLGVTISSTFKKRCLVIDGDLKLPSAGFHLNIIEPEITLAEFLKGDFVIQQTIKTHESGLHLIPGSVSEEDLPPQKIKEGIQQIAGDYDWIIIDTPACIDDNLKNIIALSDEVIIVSSPDFPAISGSLKAVKLAKELNIKVMGVALNRVRGKNYEIDSDKISEVLEAPIIASIPEDAAVSQSLSKKKPITLDSPNSPAAKEMRKLAAYITGEKEPKKGFLEGIKDFIKKILGK